METSEMRGGEKQGHVLKRIRKISMAMDKKEFRIFTLILLLLLTMIGLLVYYFL
jgi:hypothetical protein